MIRRIPGRRVYALATALIAVAAFAAVGGADRLVPNDTLFGEQYHLLNTGQSGGTAGEDIKVVNVWDTRQGTNIAIAVIDTGIEGTHADLADNFSTSLSLDINAEPDDTDPAPVDDTENHGTQVAGCAAARGNNAVGVSGSAPRATFAGIRLIAAATTDAEEALAMSHQNSAIHVKTNSWGPQDGTGELATSGSLWKAAIQDGVINGRGGKGVVYLWAAGNGGADGPDNVNYDAYANNRNVVAVASVDRTGKQSTFSEPGAAILVTAPGTDIRTTDRTGAAGDDATDYATNSGTSFATPIVAGVVALMLEANPNLLCRDVMWLLATTSDQNDAADSDWKTNGAGLPVSHKYGHGRVNAQAAVTAAATWSRVPPESVVTGTASPAVSIPDNSTSGVTSTVSVSDPIVVEHVEIEVNVTHPSRGELAVTLTSPSGTESRLAVPRTEDTNADYAAWVFMTTLAWGENGSGNWVLKVEDRTSGNTGTLASWTLRVYGVRSISITPSSLSFTILKEQGPQSQALTVANGTNAALTANVTTNQPWLTASPATVTIGVGLSASVTVTVDPAGAAMGSNSGTVTLTDASDPSRKATVAVTLIVPSVLDEDDGGGDGSSRCDVEPGARPDPGSAFAALALFAALWLATRRR